MKKVLVFTLPLLLLSVSCEKIEQMFPRTTGSEIVFGHSSTNGTDTKAQYSGVVTGGFERIDWVNGDSIRIYCAQADLPNVKYADYFVSTVNTPSGKSSSAKITHGEFDQGLTWGAANTLHKFAALCPSPAHGISGTSVSSEGTVTCVLPSVQKHSGITYRKSGNKSPLAATNSKYIYLAGYGSATSDSEGEKGDAVDLYFDPAFTTFEFTLQNDYASGNNMTIKKAGIATGTGCLAAKYDVKVSNIGSEDAKTLRTSDITNKVDGKDTVQMNFSPALSVAKGDSLTFTLFVQPGDDITKLTFWMVDDVGVKRSFDFKYTDPSKGTEGWVNFKAFHKSKIRGLMTPESAGWVINSIPVVAPWNKDDQKDVEMDYGLSFTTPAVTEWADENKGNVTYTD